MTKESKRSSSISIPEGANTRLNLASLRVDLTTGENSQGVVRAELIIQPQTVVAEQATDGDPQQIKLEIGLKRLQVMLLLEGGKFDFEPGYTVQTDPDTFSTEKKRQNETSMGGSIGVSAGVSTPTGLPFLKGNVDASGDAKASNKVTQTETTTHQNFLVDMDTPPPDADPNQVRRWRIGADGKGGDPERGLPYLRGNTYLNKDNRPLVTFKAQKGSNRVAVDVALAMKHDDLHVTCVESALIDRDTLMVKARLAQLALIRTLKKFDHAKIAPAIKDDEILINVTHEETDV